MGFLQLDFFQTLLEEIIAVAILLFEFIGVAILVLSGIRGMISYFRRNPLTKLMLAKGMALGLEFKLGSEILRTVVVHEFSDILTVAGIIFLRATLTFLIHWEIKNEEAHHEFNKVFDESEKLAHEESKKESSNA